MSTPLRVLILEDCPTDAELMVMELKKSDFAPAWQRVETEQAYLAALDQPLDLILADHALPQYDSARALDALKQRGLDVPFIIVSDSIDEELAVGLMKKGAADYVSKDRLARLGIVVANALQQRQLREQKRQAEQKLRDSEAWFRALLDRSHDAVVVIDRAGRIQYASPGVVRVLGQTPQEYVGSDAFARLHPDDLPRARQLFEDLLRQPGQTVTALLRAQHKDGSCRWVEASATSLFDQPPVDAVVVNYRDVTERKAAEDQLRLQSKAMEAATLGIVITDRQGTIVYVNPAFTAMTGYGREEALGQNPRILKSGKHTPQLYREMWETILVGQVWQGELTNQRKDGSLYTEVMSITPVRDEHGEITHFIAIKQDVTERKKLEAQFLQAQKMETFGQLAGGVAHDFNNLLTVITGFSQLLLSGTVSKEQSTEMLGEINKAAERAAGLTGQLLAFSRKQVRQPQVLDLNTLVAEQEKMLRRLIGEDIQLVVQRDPELHRIYADSCQIQQVILNLAVNARDAMPRGGTLTISTRNVELDEAFAWEHPRVQPGPHVLLEVRDTGCGMTPEVMARIFEPFFTTKGPGRGTGLGLPTVLGIVEQSDGVIEVESQPGLGSTFRVYLPRSLASPSGTRKLAPGPLPSGKETILLVEDDPGVRGLAALILRNAGYTVQEASTGAEAVETIRCSQRAIDLLLTDVVMPGMNGPELVNALETNNRAPKVLYMSGYLDETVVRHGVREGLDLLQKPLTPAALLRKVREVLDRNQMQDGPIEARPQRTLRILLAEDNPINQQVAVQMLQKEGHSVVTADDGKEALALWEQQNFDLILMDVQMPEMDGFATTRVIREMEQKTGRHQRIVALTAHALKGDRERCLAAGMDGYLSKPIKREDLRATINALFSGESSTGPAPRNEPEETPQPAAIVDPAVLGRVGGDVKRLRKLIGLFARERPNIMRLLGEAVAKGDAEGVQQAAHTLRGGVATLGGVAATQTARCLEDQAAAGDLSQSAEILARLEQDLDRFQDALEQLAQEQEKPS